MASIIWCPFGSFCVYTKQYITQTIHSTNVSPVVVRYAKP